MAQLDGEGTRSLIDTVARTPLSLIVEWALLFSVVRVGLYFYLRAVPAHQRGGLFAAGRFLNESLDAIVYAAVFVFMIIRPFFVQAFQIPSGSMVSTLLVNDYIVANKLIYRYTDPQRGDIVVFRPPKRACQPWQLDAQGEVNVDFIKRCIGVPGDVVEMRDNVLYRNGKPISEAYRHLTTEDPPFQQNTYRELTPDEAKLEPRFDFKLVKYKGDYWPVTIEGGEVNSRQTAKEYVPKDQLETADLLSLPAAPIPKGYYLMFGDNRLRSLDGRFWGLVPRESIVGRSECIWWPLGRWSMTRRDVGMPAR
ncbi:MAG: signal peptidase I [Fimbriimonas ginsengisoli]|uniref:Signal peptidase I n=1 Tax=Fimbriimonas ginsengisoli TaxID=1005039 RepID=A0A931LT59_FIMGI|nr:signal peptidase I [Fimbriimonas ginsengisoli]